MTTRETLLSTELYFLELCKRNLYLPVCVWIHHLFRAQLKSHTSLFLYKNGKMSPIFNSFNIEVGLIITTLSLIDQLVQRHWFLKHT
jgi:hypothetical protein